MERPNKPGLLGLVGYGVLSLLIMLSIFFQSDATEHAKRTKPKFGESDGAPRVPRCRGRYVSAFLCLV